MNEPYEPPQSDPSSPPSAEAPESPIEATPKRWPVTLKILAGLSTVFAVVFGAAFAFPSAAEDLTSFGADMILMNAVLTAIPLMLLWILWVLFLSGWKWRSRFLTLFMIGATPWVFLQLFEPVLGGDATIVGWRPFWMDAPEVKRESVTPPPTGVDLTTESETDFPRFLGSNQNGVVSKSGPFSEENFENARELWKQPVGHGWSGFVARNGFAVTMEQREQFECVTCYEIETGKLQWVYEHEERHYDYLGKTGPRSTPLIANGLVYAMGANGNLVCLNGSDGSVAWQKDLNELLKIKLADNVDGDGVAVRKEAQSRLVWGRSGSPLIVNDTLFIPGGGSIGGAIHTLLAFDPTTGDLKWKGGKEMISYASPVVATVAGRQQILLTAESKAMGFDPTDGTVLWTFDRPGHTGQDANASQISVVGDDTVMTSKGYNDGGGELIRLEAKGDSIVPSSVWRNERAIKTKLTSPVLYQGHAYSFSNGFLECARLSDGKRIWKARGKFGHGQILLAGSQLLAHSEFGELYLVDAAPSGFRSHGKISTVEGICWNTLCLTGNRVIVRSNLEAACYELPTE